MVKDILTTDQIIIGTSDNEIRTNGLKNQWDLHNLIIGGRQLEATNRGALKINDNSYDASFTRVNKPGKYILGRISSQDVKKNCRIKV